MRSLPVDEYTLYQLSMHGKLTAAGDNGAPTCTDCHGVHNIFAPSSPRSSVNRQNIVKLCGGCHANKKHMAPYDIPTDMVQKWKHSRHGKAFATGSSAAPNCIGCHGPHAGTHPGTPSIAAACDYCHTEEKKFLLKSPHARAFRSVGWQIAYRVTATMTLSRQAGRRAWRLIRRAASATAGATKTAPGAPRRSPESSMRVNDQQHAAVVNVQAGEGGGAVRSRRGLRAQQVDNCQADTCASRRTRLISCSCARTRLTYSVRQTRQRTPLQRPVMSVDVQRRGYYVALALAALLVRAPGRESAEVVARENAECCMSEPTSAPPPEPLGRRLPRWLLILLPIVAVAFAAGLAGAQHYVHARLKRLHRGLPRFGGRGARSAAGAQERRVSACHHVSSGVGAVAARGPTWWVRRKVRTHGAGRAASSCGSCHNELRARSGRRSPRPRVIGCTRASKRSTACRVTSSRCHGGQVTTKACLSATRARTCTPRRTSTRRRIRSACPATISRRPPAASLGSPMDACVRCHSEKAHSQKSSPDIVPASVIRSAGSARRRRLQALPPAASRLRQGAPGAAVPAVSRHQDRYGRPRASQRAPRVPELPQGARSAQARG